MTNISRWLDAGPASVNAAPTFTLRMSRSEKWLRRVHDWFWPMRQVDWLMASTSTRAADVTSGQCWVNAADIGPPLSRRCFNAVCCTKSVRLHRKQSEIIAVKSSRTLPDQTSYADCLKSRRLIIKPYLIHSLITPSWFQSFYAEQSGFK